MPAASCPLHSHVVALRDARAVGRGALWGLTRWCDAVLAGRGDGAQVVSALPPAFTVLIVGGPRPPTAPEGAALRRVGLQWGH